MSHQEIIEGALRKAADNGFGFDWVGKTQIRVENIKLDGIKGRIETRIYDLNQPDFIFNHDFAKALWGDKFINPEMRDDKGSKVIVMQQTAWRHHLRQMVVADDPIKYLGDNLLA